MRYRGYYYDEILTCYYLNSRYYDPNTGRFISPDALGYFGANGDFSIGPQNDTFEDLNGDPDVPSNKQFDYGVGYGKASAFVIGYHCNVSFSCLGLALDVVEYVKKRW